MGGWAGASSKAKRRARAASFLPIGTHGFPGEIIPGEAALMPSALNGTRRWRTTAHGCAGWGFIRRSNGLPGMAASYLPIGAHAFPGVIIPVH